MAQMMGLQKDLVEMACEIKTNPDEVIGYVFENQAELLKMIEDRKNSGAEFEETRKNASRNPFLVQIEEDDAKTSTKYELIGAVVHLGKSIHVGHYVSYAKKDGQWIYFNDSKVAVTEEPDLGGAYIYILKRKN